MRDGLGDSLDGDWAAVFAYARYPDGRVEKVTIFTSEVAYAQRLAGAAGGRIALPVATVQQRFPKVHPGWVIDNGDEPPGKDVTEIATSLRTGLRRRNRGRAPR